MDYFLAHISHLITLSFQEIELGSFYLLGIKLEIKSFTYEDLLLTSSSGLPDN